MSSLVDNKHVVAPEVVLMMSKIIDHKLNGLNYFDWSKTIRIYVWLLILPTHDSKEQWMEEDACLFQ